MITLRRSEERQFVPRAARKTWLTFRPRSRSESPLEGFGGLSALNEIHLSPGRATTLHPHATADVITYVHKGSLSQVSAAGGSNLILAGQFQCSCADRGAQRTHTNMSRTTWAHLFQIGLPRELATERVTHQQTHFTSAQRKGGLCLIASPDARCGSLRLTQDTNVYSSVLDAGNHLCHRIPSGHSVWLHIVCGQVKLHTIVLTTGDGAGMTGEAAVSLTAREDSEILMVEVGNRTSGRTEGTRG